MLQTQKQLPHAAAAFIMRVNVRCRAKSGR